MAMNVPNPTTGVVSTAVTGANNALKGLAFDSRQTVKLLIGLLDKKYKLGFINKGRIIKALSSIASGNKVTGILNAVGEITGKVITQAQATKILQARLDAETAQKAIERSSEVQKSAIEKGVWNNGINYNNVSNPTTAIGDSGTSGGSNTIGSFLGG